MADSNPWIFAGFASFRLHCCPREASGASAASENLTAVLPIDYKASTAAIVWCVMVQKLGGTFQTRQELEEDAFQFSRLCRTHHTCRLTLILLGERTALCAAPFPLIQKSKRWPTFQDLELRKNVFVNQSRLWTSWLSGISSRQ